MIHAHHLEKDFGSHKVLTDISFELPGSGIHALLGRNGVGKSTLLALIAGQLKPSGGELTVFGEQPFDRASVMDRVCFTGVDTPYPASWALVDVVAAAAKRYPNWSQSTAEMLMRDFGLDAQARTAFGKASRGQRAMVGIVIGLASGAELTLLDEPYVGLDVHNTSVFYRHLLAHAESERCFILATHHIDDAAKILDSALVLGRQGSVDKHLHAEDADGYVIATGNFDEPAGALAYRRTATAARAILPAETAAEMGLRTQTADLGDVLEAVLEVQQ
ncbi:ABC transporter ATP-binding protein [uncultured Corynebacterium sp.]|uniref:ATP-binding cassette domain-containing protein n=1 Tax=uncultured Corynebacterium sp. TaxID=159447 RepID=UPI002606051D|nr:ABC transporter ATP-binding protein [uncultured Corynebacterium sp.]